MSLPGGRRESFARIAESQTVHVSKTMLFTVNFHCKINQKEKICVDNQPWYP